MKGRAALITGSVDGIGFAIAEALARKLIAERMAASGKPEAETITDYLAGRQPSRRFIEPRRVGALAAFLCGDDACDITGMPIAIDGGWLANS